MKILGQTKALEKLSRLKKDFQNHLRANYEHKAQSCETCPTQGACCTDAHFVNVHITRLEAAAIKKMLKNLGAEGERKILEQARQTIEKYDLKSSEDTFAQTFACPLFEKKVGCLVHSAAKPAPCIHHACYENETDLPPDELLEEVECKVEKLNRKTYGKDAVWLPLPLWLVNDD